MSPVRRVAGRRWVLLTAVAVVAVVGCGQAPAASPGSETTTTVAAGSTVAPAGGADSGEGSGDRDGSWEFPSCDDVPDLAAPPEAYRDEPIYVADEAPVEEVQAWAESQPGYEEIWIGDHLGWIEVAFSRDAEARQRDLEEEFAGVGVVAVPVERTKAELEALAFRVQRELAQLLIKHDAIGVGAAVSSGVAYLKVGVLTEELRREIARRFSGAPLCVDGRDPATVPAPGPQPSGGDGWLLLAEEDGGSESAWRVGLATDAAGLAVEWAELGFAAPLPEVDFGEHVVVSFGTSHGSNCPDIRLDDVVVDDAVVYPEIVNLTTNLICNDDYYAYTYVVALERSRLPSGPFVIQSEAELWSNSKPEQRLIVDVDLSAPGAVAGPDEARHDAGLPEPTPPEQRHIWPDDPWPHLLDARCGIEWLGKVDGYAWRTDEPMPEEWEGSLDADGALNVTATLRVEPETLIEAELGGKTVVYKPTVEEMPECDQP